MMEAENNYFFSVIVTAFNCEKYILETLKSIEKQTFQDYETIIIDDYSQDNTRSIINGFLEKENWSLYSNRKNMGVVFSRNKAFELAKGKYIAIIDGDDVWEKDKLEKQYEILKNNDIGLCYTSYSFIDEDSKHKKYIYKTKETATFNSLLKENYIGASTAVFKTEFVKKFKMDPSVVHEDYYYWLTLLKNGVKAQGIVEPLVKYRIHIQGRSYNKLEAAKNRFRIYRQHEKFSLIKSIVYFDSYVFHAIIKYLLMYLEGFR